MSESRIVHGCLEWLAKRRLFGWRNNTGAYKTAAGAYVKYGHPGSSDIIAIVPIAITVDMVGSTIGCFAAIECKGKGGRQDQKQKLFQRMVEKNGGLYIIARSNDDLERNIHITKINGIDALNQG